MFKLIGLMMLVCVALPGWSQTSAGSTYSIFGLGELQPRATIQSRGMGFTSIALSSPYWANTVNPAANVDVGGFYTHIFDMGLYYNNTSYKTNESVQSLSDGGISQLSYWFRFNQKWTGIAGIAPFSKVGYNITKNDVRTDQGELYNIIYSGSGGLNEVYFSQSYKLLPQLTLGARLFYIMGSIEHQELAYKSSSYQDSLSVISNVSVHKLNVDFGLNYKIQKEKYAINLGVIYDDKTNLRGNTLLELSDPNAEVIYEESENLESYALPQKVGFGTSFVNDKLMIAGDVEFNQWSKVNIGDTGPLNDTWRYSAGVDYTPNRKSAYYLANVSYRLGYYQENSYLNVDETPYNTWGMTFGLGLPLNADGAINLAYNRKVNGTLNNDLILETTHEISIGISIRNLWFRKVKYD